MLEYVRLTMRIDSMSNFIAQEISNSVLEFYQNAIEHDAHADEPMKLSA